MGQKVTFSCETEGETVGYTLSPDHTIMCGLEGQYPDPATWPDCAVKCPVPPPGDETFAAQPATTNPMDVGGTLEYHCAKSGHTHVVNDELVSTHTVTCQVSRLD